MGFRFWGTEIEGRRKERGGKHATYPARMGHRARLPTRSVADRRSSKSIKQQRSIFRVVEAEAVKPLAVLPKEKSQLSSSMVQMRRSRSLWVPYLTASSSEGGR